MAKLVEINGLLKLPPEVQGKFADDNVIKSFKGRTIDSEQSIQVYRNLHKKGRVYSVKQNGLVVAHATAICIRNVEFVINQSGKKRAIRTGVRNVHAFISGEYAINGMGTTAKRNDLPIEVKYNPFESEAFYFESPVGNKKLKSARFVIANQDGVKSAYIST